MSGQDNAALMRRLIEDGFGRANLETVEELMEADFVEHQRGAGSGIEGARQIVETLHRWMSDFSLTVEDVAVAGDLVWTRNRGRGLNTGWVMGNPPTNRRVEIDVIDIARFRDGRVVEHWGVADQLGMMLQLGFIPSRDRSAGSQPSS